MSAHLLVIDLQAAFAAADSPWYVPRFDTLTEPVQRLVDAHSPAVTFSRFVAPATPQGAWADYYARWPFALVDEKDALYRLVEPFRNHEADALALPTFGKWGPELAARAGDAEVLVVCGVATDCCVLSTVLAAADAGRRVVVAADACAGVTDADHDRALDAMRLYAPIVDVTDVDTILAARRD